MVKMYYIALSINCPFSGAGHAGMFCSNTVRDSRTCHYALCWAVCCSEGDCSYLLIKLTQGEGQFPAGLGQF